MTKPPLTELTDVPRDLAPMVAVLMFRSVMLRSPSADPCTVAVALISSLDPPTRRLGDERYGMAARAIVTEAIAIQTRQFAAAARS